MSNSSVIYIIDTSSLIELGHLYPLETPVFAIFWNRIKELVEEKRLISLSFVKEELKDDDARDFFSDNSAFSVPFTEKLQNTVKMILMKYPDMIRLRSSHSSNADPFLVAAAILEGYTIVTEEKLSRDFSIPNIASAFGVRTIGIAEFLQIEIF